MVQKNIPEAEKSAAEMLRMAKLNESLIDLEIAALVQMVQVGNNTRLMVDLFINFPYFSYQIIINSDDDEIVR